MADICDVAQERYEINMAKALNAVTRKVATQKIVSTGFCLFCEEPIKEGSTNPRFCGSSCRDDFDKSSRKR